ncbi:HK97-gp10 family putative phage morphogenesis protein [Marinobacter sp. BGYM27]|uniref:HK97-gp10 family putative phage morphogenesis protein n=1 Tax=Marinobacter sp. BGYM27 TaxID=2975597 RepID=UPI0021A937FC|nr:HK97-gp10 family putative phage morphogenesis protein [Marinobacter sp. BGYM27]MDG5498967.1 HK97 gp10 family phage protein [Marinobacter sp. BGYM27]
MADSVTFDVSGLNALADRLATIQDDIKYKGGRFALRKAANLVRDAAKANARSINDPATPEDIAENIAVRWSSRRFKRTGDLMFRVGVRGGAKEYAKTRENARKQRVGKSYPTGGDKTNPGGDTWHWRLVEFGSETNAARPFLRPALASNIDRASREFVNQYGKALDRAIKRAGGK